MASAARRRAALPDRSASTACSAARRPARSVVAAKGRWLSESEFEITSRLVTEGLVMTYRLDFRGNEVDVSVHVEPGLHRAHARDGGRLSGAFGRRA